MKLASVIVIDDDQFVLTTLKHALTGLNVSVVGTGTSAGDAISLAKNSLVDVAILDLDLGFGASGIDIAYALRKEHPTIGLILLTSYSDPRISDPASREMPLGTIFITKSKLSDMGTLISAIALARKNPLVKSRKNLETISLTNRQIEVLKLLADGVSTVEIAKQLEVTEKAIEAMITRLHSDLHLVNGKRFNKRVQLARAYFSLSGKKPPGA